MSVRTAREVSHRGRKDDDTLIPGTGALTRTRSTAFGARSSKCLLLTRGTTGKDAHADADGPGRTLYWEHLRTFQRRVRDWRALKGPDLDVKFRQLHKPGSRASQIGHIATNYT